MACCPLYNIPWRTAAGARLVALHARFSKGAPRGQSSRAGADRRPSPATGILNTGGNVVGFFGGLLVPFIAEFFSWPAAMASGAGFALIGAVLWLFIRADQPMRGA
jgi:hypothetical protein